MPNRILKESICRSYDIEKLSWFEEVFYYRLIVNCDDYGRYYADPLILKGSLFPLKTSVTAEQIQKALYKLSSVGLVSTYMVEEKPFLQIIAWEKHQQVRNQKSKYPGIDESDISCNQLKSIDINCNQLKSNVTVIQSESNPNPNPKYNNELARQVIDYLNQKTNSKYGYTGANMKHIKARIAEKHSFDDFKTVIDKKYDEWNDTDWSKFLRPETLFGAKFESYLNQKPMLHKYNMNGNAIKDLPDYMNNLEAKEALDPGKLDEVNALIANMSEKHEENKN